MVSKKNMATVACGAVGVIFLVVGCVLIHVFSDLIHSAVKDNIPLKKDGDSYKNWKAPKSPIYFQVWMFDVQNRDEIIAGEKPVVREMGPYTYRETREKVNITYYENGTLTYEEKRFFSFQRHLSVGSENDTFHCVNLPMLTIANLVRYEYKVLKDLINAILKVTGEGLFIELSVHDLMWGYEDKLLKAVDDLAKTMKLNFTVSPIFGLFAGQNGSSDGVYQIYSGLKGIENFGEIISWNGQSSLDYWTSVTANMINGSDGTIYPPFIDTSATKYLFSSDLCRSLGMDYSKSVSHRGIDMDRFIAPDILFANSSVNPYNKGFCTPKNNCLPSGLLNVSVCREGAPIVMSMPHFLGCDESTVEAVVGMHPDRAQHQSFIDIEPMTGVVMNAGKRLQVNVHLEKIDGFWDTENIQRVFMPVLWLNESALISPSDASKFRSAVLDKIKMTDAIKYGLIALGAFLMACVLLILAKGKLCPASPGNKELLHSADYDPLVMPHGSVSS